MKKQLALAAVLAIALGITTNSAFSAPVKSTPTKATAETRQAPCNRADWEKKRAEWEKLTPAQKEAKREEMRASHEKRANNFDEKLGLTEAQKTKAKALREKGREQMKPIMEQMGAKKDEIRKIKESDISDAQKEKKITAIRTEIKPLKEKADTMRKANMQEFEAILTAEQKTKLEAMKKEGPKYGPKGRELKDGCEFKKRNIK